MVRKVKNQKIKLTVKIKKILNKKIKKKMIVILMIFWIGKKRKKLTWIAWMKKQDRHIWKNNSIICKKEKRMLKKLMNMEKELKLRLWKHLKMFLMRLNRYLYASYQVILLNYHGMPQMIIIQRLRLIMYIYQTKLYKLYLTLDHLIF